MLDADNTAQLIYLGLLLAALAGWLTVEFRKRGSQMVRTGLAWGLIVVGLMAGYGLWEDIQRQSFAAQEVTGSEVRIPMAGDGHYYPSLTIQGQEVRFMADTGATSVVLSHDAARSLGIEPETLVYTGQAMTANGPVRTAQVRLTDVQLGPYRDAAIMASVNEVDMPYSLLGMDYLQGFRVTIGGDEMVLTR